MKSNNLIFTMLLALPLFIFADNVADETTEEVVEEAVVAEAEAEEVTEDAASEYVSEEDVEDIVVTGSRIRKSTFTSIAPLQILSTDISREAGLIDAADILQESPTASGQQIDLSFSGFSLDNGPGSSTISLRGLGSGRTLVLINGRRVGPAGVEGAPSSPDLNLLPSALVQRYELLLDGASSVYGSDAIAGVSNAILRSDFDGFEFEIYTKESPHQDGFTDDRTMSIAYGKSFDRGFFGMAYETVYNPEVQFVDRPWTDDCTVDYEETEQGDIRTKNVYYEVQYGDYVLDCQFEFTVGKVASYLGFGPWTIAYRDGFGTGYETLDPNADGWFPESMGNAVEVDINPRDGVTDYTRRYFNTNGNDLYSTMYPEFDRDSFMAYGEYTLDNKSNTTLFFELQTAKRETYSNYGASQLNPWVDADYLYNICNPNSEIGFDCNSMGAYIYNNPDFIADSNERYEALYGPSTNYGFPAWWGVDPETGSIAYSYFCYYAIYYGDSCVDGAGPIPVMPFVSIVGDRTAVKATVEQDRFVVGARGDLDINFKNFSGWTYETSFTSTESTGKSFRSGIRGDRLSFALGFDPSAPYGDDPSYGGWEFGGTKLSGGYCDPTGSVGEIRADVIEGCVPVNLFAPSIFEGISGDFETQAERDYLFDQSVFDTTITQDVYSAFATGVIGSIPGGDVAAVIGIEKQELEINSTPDFIADEGLFFGFTSNGGAKGKQVNDEAYFEVALPLLAGVKYAEELNLEMSGRHTETTNTNFYNNVETSDSGKTYSIKLSYRPIQDLLLRATRGTAFRAPNLRESALREEQDNTSVYDYCMAPRSAIVLSAENGYEYDRSKDFRDQQTIENCIAAGLDPVQFGNTLLDGDPGTNSTSPNPYSVDFTTGGASGLNSETSLGSTFGFVYEIPYYSLFKDSDGTTSTTIGMTRYDIEINDSIVELSPGYVNYQCYVATPNQESTFCNQLTRDPGTNQISDIETGFLNRDAETAAGIDLNILHQTVLNFNGKSYDFGIDITANTVRERSLLYVDDNGNVDFEDYAGEPGYPEYNIFSRMYMELGDWRVSWQTNFLSRVDQDQEDSLDDWGSANGVKNEDGDNIFSDTCYGYTKDRSATDETQVEVGDTVCRDIGWIKAYVTHNASAYYYQDNLTLGFGVRNVFDKEPPMVDPSEISSKSNTPLGYGYNLNGREFFFNVRYNF